jgi:nucleotide-binding universal stress UspA family protein
VIKLEQLLFPVDFSDVGVHALRYARSFAQSYKATLHLLHVVDEASQYWMALGPNSLPVGPPPEELIQASRTQLERFIQEHLADAGLKLQSDVVLGRPFLEIIRYARENNIDLIIMGTHGRGGIQHVLLGSVAERVVRKAPCPVLTIRHPEHDFVMP